MICNRQDCPVEFARKAMNQWRAEQIASGVAKAWSVNDYQMSCRMCGKPKAWRRDADGEEREIANA